MTINREHPLTGGCVCGQVRYEITKAPIAMFKCHCRTCQMSTGGPYVPVVLVWTKAFKITQGTLQYYATESVSGVANKRGFCGHCGSRLTGAEREEERKPWLGVTASSLDDPSIFKPLHDVFTSHAQVWDLLDPDIPKHEQYPPARKSE